MKKAAGFLFLFGLFLAACGGGNAGGGDPAQTVEKYLQAKVDGDADTIRGLLCADMEQFLERESRTFDSVQDVRIEGMSCEDAGNGRVTCTGTIKALYGTEETEFPLTNYKVVQEDGEWKWCGETQ
jgi:ketosteroid isomerase-like protein